MTKELAKTLLEKTESGTSSSLKDIWAAYRKKEVQVEVKMSADISQGEPESETISKEETEQPAPEVKKAGSEVERIGDRLVNPNVA